ncbi:hypothetical protein [Thalassotalea sp. PLHSN55]|uniref:hypothetical protein n=1 Tax=Thalassotalea sp. PLHSN55 TaxID=3435888 RepID=UPI003F845B10
MGVIVTFFTTMFSGVTGLIGLFLARKATFSLAYIGIYIVLSGLFIATISSLLGGISASAPSNSLLSAGLSLLPSNAAQCVGVISAAHVASYIFVMKNKLLNLKVKA